MSSRIWKRILPIFGLALLPAIAVGQVTLPTDVVLTQVASGLSGPTAIVSPHDASGRMFVVENRSGEGRLRIIDAGGNLLATPYWSRAITGGSGSEQGMLGLAFDPDFATNGVLYVTYTAPGSDPRLGSQPDQVLTRLTASDPAANVFSGSEDVVLRIPDPYWNHNGGNIVFGPDNLLYWGMGDGGSGGDPNGFSQDLWKKAASGGTYYLLGKMMRLDVRHPATVAAANQCGATPGQPAQYSIPADNPYAGASDKCGEIWLYGLRNPWRWSFDRKTGDLVIGDVGQNQYEEIDFRAVGDTGNNNYGWRLCEGNHYYTPSGSGTTCPATTGTVAPVIEYSHASTGGCSVTGGYIYRGPIASLHGRYVFSDYCGGKIWLTGADPLVNGWQYAALAGTPGMNTYSFGEDEIGNLYAVDGGGRIYRFDSTTVPTTYVITPLAGQHGALVPGLPQTVEEGETVAFSVNPDPGYAIGEVSGCGGSLAGTTYTTAPASADCTVTASFVAITHTVTPVAGAGGSITPDTPQVVADGATIQFTLEADAGHVIGTVSGCGGTLVDETYTTGPVHADCTVTASFVTDPDIIFQDGFEER
ncbi:MAG: PQQ-dependent sugar dehydrogenase [Xanthomonadales bacterium]|nr:PQQ-dependent sugar dehydrogenase [Xanthomonadales bacterium]